ncbi:hypothetical protein [Actinomadura sp. WMMB 499]|uniref:hypothetical protein n=1 Tax=Actinomadura sp. WMMB 499 TaxID=1219491 RepID=UPI0012475DDB|nr:hypothetical protein [Actinomadura sp. WMMB 499]QFG24712.1 hypothetical protein F7P10_29785 [Actinomadura sp. WMMB 499]
MLRTRLVALTIAAVAAVALLFWPVVMTYTLVAGEQGTASVARCVETGTGKNYNLSCTGTWRTGSGGSGSGEIYGLDEGDAGTDVPVRVGPMGPYAGGFGRNWIYYLPLVPLLLAPAVMVWALRATLGPGRRLAKSLLADPAGGTLLIVTPKRVDHANGLPLAVLGPSGPPPPGYRPVDVPGRALRAGGRTPLDAAAGINRDRSEFRPLVSPGGQALAIVEHRSAKGREPDHVLLDPSGATVAVVRRISPSPPRFALIDPGGAPLGSAGPTGGKRSASLLVTDARGAAVATIAHAGRRSVVRVENAAPRLYRDAALVLALAQYRTAD